MEWSEVLVQGVEQIKEKIDKGSGDLKTRWHAQPYTWQPSSSACSALGLKAFTSTPRKHCFKSQSTYYAL